VCVCWHLSDLVFSLTDMIHSSPFNVGSFWRLKSDYTNTRARTHTHTHTHTHWNLHVAAKSVKRIGNRTCV